jgi:glycosyltransferase involved in cell wall biosynthesis
MTKAKGVHVLIKALKLVKGKYAAKLIGTGEDTAYFKSLANRLGVKAKFLGRVSDETLKEYYQRTRMVVVPSLFPELCSMVILEAMSYGKPIIASNIGGNPDLVINGQTGYLFEPGNEAKLAEHISELISNEKAALQMGSRGLRLSAKFSRQAHHKLLSEAYNEAMNSEKPC